MSLIIQQQGSQQCPMMQQNRMWLCTTECVSVVHNYLNVTGACTTLIRALHNCLQLQVLYLRGHAVRLLLLCATLRFTAIVVLPSSTSHSLSSTRARVVQLASSPKTRLQTRRLRPARPAKHSHAAPRECSKAPRYDCRPRYSQPGACLRPAAGGQRACDVQAFEPPLSLGSCWQTSQTAPRFPWLWRRYKS